MGKYREYMERPKLTFKKKRYEHCREAFQFNSGVSDVVWGGLSVLLVFFFFLKSYVSLTLYNCIKEYNPMFMTKVTKFRFCRGLCLQGEPLFRCVPSVWALCNLYNWEDCTNSQKLFLHIFLSFENLSKHCRNSKDGYKIYILILKQARDWHSYHIYLNLCQFTGEWPIFWSN